MLRPDRAALPDPDHQRSRLRSTVAGLSFLFAIAAGAGTDLWLASACAALAALCLVQWRVFRSGRRKRRR
jgi:fatty acid desaturase